MNRSNLSQSESSYQQRGSVEPDESAYWHEIQQYMSKTDRHRADNELIAEILNGNSDCYRKIVNQYSSLVFHAVRGFEKDEDEVKELSQQIFVKAFEKLGSFNRRSKFSSWLYSLALNHCRDYVKNIRRKNYRFSEFEDEFQGVMMSDPKKTPYEDLEIKEWKQLLDQALRNLNGDYSEPFLLKYRDGMSYEVMSGRLGVSVSALKVRVHRARKELKTLIGKEMER